MRDRFQYAARSITFSKREIIGGLLTAAVTFVALRAAWDTDTAVQEIVAWAITFAGGCFMFVAEFVANLIRAPDKLEIERLTAGLHTKLDDIDEVIAAAGGLGEIESITSLIGSGLMWHRVGTNVPPSLSQAIQLGLVTIEQRQESHYAQAAPFYTIEIYDWYVLTPLAGRALARVRARRQSANNQPAT